MAKTNDNYTTARDQSYPRRKVQVWRPRRANRCAIRIMGVEKLPLSFDGVGAFLPLKECRRLIRRMTEICDQLEQEKK